MAIIMISTILAIGCAVLGSYLVLGAAMNFNGFGFQKNLKVKEFRASFGNFGARVAMMLFGVGFYAFGIAV
jgi:uncharacterized membrane protein